MTLRRAERSMWRWLAAAVLAWATWSAAAAGPATPQDYLHAASPFARSLAHFGWLALSVFCLAAVVMWALLTWIVARRRGSFDEHEHVATDDGQSWVIVGGLVIPGLVFFVLFGLMFGAVGSSAMHPGHAGPPADIRVTGRQWWFDAEYVGDGLNDRVHVPTEIHIPVGRAVQLDLVTRDVIHSFWVPRLQGKVDLVPGSVNRITLRADRPGVYDGECAEFCGPQHAQMRLQVVAQAESDYRTWLATQRQDASATTADMLAEQGREVFLASACPLCHTVRGTSARGTVGPDLTHVGARRRIAGGAFVNDSANLAAWVTDAQSMKPGSKMPTLRQMDGADLRALVHYLQTLR
jgi:cytochrome c oxidase subunit 2